MLEHLSPPAAAGVLMTLVGAAAALLANWVLRIQWRWLACGALLWAVAATEKSLIDSFLNGVPSSPPTIRTMSSGKLISAACFYGLLTGMTEVAVTLAAGLLWPRLAQDARRAVGIGLGAGAIEAAYFGMADIVAALQASAAGQVAPAVSTTAAVAILIPPLERLILIPCHAAARATTLYAVATKRWQWFAAGFAILSLPDALCACYVLTGAVTSPKPWPMNPWLVQLTFAPFALLSLPILRHLWRTWPPNSRA